MPTLWGLIVLNSAIYRGTVTHCRHLPKKHRFHYHIFLFWLDLDEIERVKGEVKGISDRRFSPVNFRRSDYLGNPAISHKQAVLKRMSELASKPLLGKVFMLGQARMFGLYFSPVNFYYLQNAQGYFSHLLAEVSNTPWNQRHYYLVDLKEQKSHEKTFHVSPFNPMDMQYHWRVQQPNEQLNLLLSVAKQERHFEAGLQLKRQPLTSATLRTNLLSVPSMAIKTLFGIYWQALLLLIKGIPVYSYPKNKETQR